MKTNQLSEPQPDAPIMNETLPPINLFTMFRLGTFQMGLGMMTLLTLGVINRVMIDELKVPALITAGAIAMHQFVAPARVWFGQMSDAKPMMGMHRTAYVWLGALLFTSLSFVALQVVWQLGDTVALNGWTPASYPWAVILAAIFALYGLALSMSSTPFAALLVDISDDDNRSKLVSIVWSMLMVGIIIGAIVSSGLLKQIALDAPIAELKASINRLFIIIPAIVFSLAIIATFGVEKKYSRYAIRSTVANREDQITFGKALKILTANRQTGIFFCFVLIMTISLFMQDAILEPYGGQVFKMEIAQTTRLNAFLGMGTLMGIGSTGFLIVPRLGKQKTAKYGCIGAAVCSGLFIMAGFVGQPGMLMGVLVLFGLLSGILTAGVLSLMLDLTAAETAGTFIGAWGLAQAIARGLSTVLGGAILDAGRNLFTEPVLAYGTVFATQAVGMLLSIILLNQVNIQEFRDNARATIMTIIEGELD
ncbi:MULTISPECIES: BCD family MFS transporter [Planktothricoides]|uniref:BCD family MFS transporter n=2 Tax=Planktothricoides raciborskii TaxID=132608 RepID=A0ABR8EHP8_9CYAN|nr:MFS transporter [Planktothricoides sp. SR001]MBD2546141.1 BCD family MFS transporter [Planktothricoides raciborskii FACHB-1370]MBD2583861.1 BCD family MFS transporter [Planktothricoides raciborskii FACHB-1261]